MYQERFNTFTRTHFDSSGASEATISWCSMILLGQCLSDNCVLENVPFLTYLRRANEHFYCRQLTRPKSIFSAFCQPSDRQIRSFEENETQVYTYIYIYFFDNKNSKCENDYICIRFWSNCYKICGLKSSSAARLKYCPYSANRCVIRKPQKSFTCLHRFKSISTINRPSWSRDKPWMAIRMRLTRINYTNYRILTGVLDPFGAAT